MLRSVPTKSDIEKAHLRIAPFVHRTPVLTNSYLNELSGASLYFKCENFQKIGAFKARGATNAVLSLSGSQLAKGVITHSSGNHAQAVALAAQQAQTHCTVVMPNNAPKAKVNATQGYGAEVVFCEPTIAARQKTVDDICAKTGAHFIHPYDNYEVIAGQASCAKEIIEDYPDLEVLITPVGGGGLLAGTLLSAAYFGKQIVYAAEPELVDDAYRGFKSGVRQEATNKPTLADGLKTDVGEKNFSIMQEYLADIFLVSEEEMVSAMRLIWERMKIIIEPSCAVPLAAILKNKLVFQNKKVGVVLTGGNVDLTNLPF